MRAVRRARRARGTGLPAEVAGGGVVQRRGLATDVDGQEWPTPSRRTRPSDGARDLAGEWIVTGYYTGDAIQSVITSTTLTARFEEGVVSGDAGCNLFNGPFEVTGEQITIGPLASTLAACVDPAVRHRSRNTLPRSQLATTFQVTGDRLDLFRPGGTIAATFERPTK